MDNRHRKLAPKDLKYQICYNIRSKKKYDELIESLSRDEWVKIEITSNRKTVIKNEVENKETPKSIKDEQERILIENKN